ncbi:MAG: hypothetical protein ACK5HT_22545 [Draconibacterium sp.]
MVIENITSYGIDKIEFLSIQEDRNVRVDLSEIRPIKRSVATITVHTITEKSDKELFLNGFRSKIILSKFAQPSNPELFEKLHNVHFLFNRPHVVEVYKDVAFTCNQEAISSANYQIDRAYMIYTHGGCMPHIINTTRFETHKKEIPSTIHTEKHLDDYLYRFYLNQFEKKKDGKYARKDDSEFIGTRILYLATKESVLNYAVYARLSKRDRKPVTHSEFRFKGDKAMQKLGILDREKGTLKAIQQNLISNARQIYKETLKKRIKLNEINWYKLAKLELGWENKKIFSEKDDKKIQLCVSHLKRQIPTYTAGFVAYANEMGLNYRQYLK